MIWTQSSGSCEGNVKSGSTTASMQYDTKNARILSSQETLPLEAVESTLSHEHFFRRKQYNFFNCASFRFPRSYACSLITH